jgi:hypothetical protein
MRDPGDVSRALRAAGWSIGDKLIGTAKGRSWLVSGSNGKSLIRAKGKTRDEAWGIAFEQARAVGLVLKSRTHPTHTGSRGLR